MFLLHERFHTEKKTFTVDKIITMFYLDNRKFSIQSYVVESCYNRLSEAFLVDTNNIRCYGTILKQIIFYHFNTNPSLSPFSLYVRCKHGATFCTEMFPCCVVR